MLTSRSAKVNRVSVKAQQSEFIAVFCILHLKLKTLGGWKTS